MRHFLCLGFCGGLDSLPGKVLDGYFSFLVELDPREVKHVL